jgi:hypothetical protein
MSRRRFTIGAAIGAGASALVAVTTPGCGKLGLYALLPDIREAARLGQLVLVHDRDAAAAGEALVATLDAEANGDSESMRDAFFERRRADFAALDTVVVDGWVLARAEAEICAACARVVPV